MVDGRSGKDVSRWRGSCFKGMRCQHGGESAASVVAGCFEAREARRLQPGGVLTQTRCGPVKEALMSHCTC